MRAWMLMVVVLTACPGVEPTPTPGPAPRECQAVPPSIDLGSVDVGATAQRALTGLPSDTVATVDAPFTTKLLEGALVLTATPTTVGAHTATLHVDQGCGTTATVQVTVTAVAPCVEVPSSLVFSPVEYACGRAAQTLVVTNRCASEVQLGATVVEPPDGPDAWCAGGVPCREFHLISGAQTVSANSSTELSLVATPAAVGAREATLQVQVHHLDGVSTHEVALSATGLDRARVTERFEAPPRLQLEFLLLIDTSAAARANWASLRENLGSLGMYWRSYREVAHVKVHLAAADLAATTSVLLDGDAVDLEVELLRALEQLPVTSTPSCLGPALRLAGALPTACIMYSQDQSPTPVSEVLRALRGSVSVVGPIEAWSPCVAQADDGRLAQVAQRTGGVLETVCAPEWATVLLSLPTEWGFSTTSLFLARPALRAPDRLVFIKATASSTDFVVPRESGAGVAGAWTWDAQLNRVTIGSSWWQYPGGPAVDVTYEPACQEFP